MKPHYTSRIFKHVHGGFYAIVFADGIQHVSTFAQADRQNAARDGAHIVWRAVRTGL